MLEFESKRKIKKRLYSKFTLFVLVIILAFIANGTYKIFKKQRIVRNDLNASISILDLQQERKDILIEEMDKIDSPVGREEILRENFSLAKDNEEAVYIIAPEEEEIEIVEERGFWNSLEVFFGGLFN